ncbi:MAG: PrsW family intramembrane metalloprotease [Caldilineaceae bacterium]|nr:PrsW family intramembrane metalloprotease [Caldilineaceae bacterium]
MIPAIVVAVAIPLAFLLLVQRLDLYASGTLRTLVVCMVAGLAAFLAAYQLNSALVPFFGYALMVTLVAPMIEEVLKSLVLIYYVRRPDFTYFVDGAIYGFAAGVAFAVAENLLYLSRVGDSGGFGLALTRAFSTSLMHGSASALVGVALGRLRFGRGLTRFGALALGWSAAIGLHLAFNNLISRNWGVLTIIFAIVLGLSGVLLNGLLIRWGLRAEQAWLRETLDQAVGVSRGEAAVVQELAQLDRLLAPVAERFGPQKRQQVETFLRRQAQLGLKRKVEVMTLDPQLRQAMAAEVVALREEVDALRRAIGVYCMSYVRSILPPASEPLWQRLNDTLTATPVSTKPSLWRTLDTKMNEPQA